MKKIILLISVFGAAFMMMIAKAPNIEASDETVEYSVEFTVGTIIVNNFHAPGVQDYFLNYGEYSSDAFDNLIFNNVKFYINGVLQTESVSFLKENDIIEVNGPLGSLWFASWDNGYVDDQNLIIKKNDVIKFVFTKTEPTYLVQIQLFFDEENEINMSFYIQENNTYQLTEYIPDGFEDYVFMNWVVDGVVTEYPNFHIFTITKNTELRAIYGPPGSTPIDPEEPEEPEEPEDPEEPNPVSAVHKITFHPNHTGTIIPFLEIENDVGINYNNITEHVGSMEREGYIFIGWYLNTALTIPLDPNATFEGENNHLYAKWEIIQIQIHANLSGGKMSDGSMIYTPLINYGSKLSSLLKPTKSGYTFRGWALLGSEEIYTETVTETMMIEALWKEKTSGLELSEKSLLLIVGALVAVVLLYQNRKKKKRW